MSEPTPRIVLCPTCGARVKWSSGNEFRPFCSERCKLIDLGAWASEQHRIPGDRNDDLLSGDLEGGSGPESGSELESGSGLQPRPSDPDRD